MKRTTARIGLTAVLLGAVGTRDAVAWNFDWAGRVADDASGLSEESATTRLAAVAQLASDDPSLAAPYLLRALQDNDNNVRLEAARALGRLRVAAAAETMVNWLADADPATRAAAAEVLGAIGGDVATSALVRSLGDIDAGVRLRAVSGLGRIGAAGANAVVIPLIGRLEDDKAEVRRRVIEQLEAIADRRATIPLIATIGDSSPEVRKAGIHALGVLGDPVALPALLRLLRDAPEEFRALAVTAIGTIGSVAAIDPLIDVLGVGSDVFRAKVAYALGLIAARPANEDSPTRDADAAARATAVRALVNSLAQPSMRAAAREALSVAGPVAVPALIAQLDSHSAGDPTTIVELLRATHDPRATKALIAELDRGRIALPLGIEALGATGDSAALIPVLTLTSHPESTVRLAAMKALAPLLGRDARAADVLIDRLDDDSLDIRVLAATYLGDIHARASVAKLLALLAPGTPPRLRVAAIDALGAIGDAKAAAPLLRLYREGGNDLHRQIADALTYLADDATAPQLLALIDEDQIGGRHQLVRALAAVGRRVGNATGELPQTINKALLRLAGDADVRVSVAAIDGLATSGVGGASQARLMDIARDGDPDRARAALMALGDRGEVSSAATIVASLSSRDDRVAAAAAWALGQLAIDSPGAVKNVATPANIDALVAVARHGGWAGSVDATAALARIARIAPALVRPHATDITALTYHRSSLVRINAALAVAACFSPTLNMSEWVAGLGLMVSNDSSVAARHVAAHTLGAVTHGDRTTLGSAAAGLDAAVAQAKDHTLAELARHALAGQTTALPVAARDEWRIFYVVDPSADDAPARQEPYFIVGADGLVWATYTDARGDITTEHFPAGDAVVMSATRQAEY